MDAEWKRSKFNDLKVGNKRRSSHWKASAGVTMILVTPCFPSRRWVLTTRSGKVRTWHSGNDCIFLSSTLLTPSWLGYFVYPQTKSHECCRTWWRWEEQWTLEGRFWVMENQVNVGDRVTFHQLAPDSSNGWWREAEVSVLDSQGLSPD